jgi:hypothetical protein
LSTDPKVLDQLEEWIEQNRRFWVEDERYDRERRAVVERAHAKACASPEGLRRISGAVRPLASHPAGRAVLCKD